MFLQYKEGSSRQGKGSGKFRVPDMKWVGLRPSQLDDLDLPEQASSGSPKETQPLHLQCCIMYNSSIILPPSLLSVVMMTMITMFMNVYMPEM